jgi:hypothetical protein
MEDPSSKVWDGIRGSLERDDFARPGRGERRSFFHRKGVVPWVVTLTALLLATTWDFMRKTDSDVAPPPATAVASIFSTPDSLHIPGPR